MAVFKARVDTINVHRGHPGNHPGHLTDTFDRIISEEGLKKSAVLNFPSDEHKALKKAIQEVACEEYLAVLCIKQADKIWYGKLKTTLANGYFNPALT